MKGEGERNSKKTEKEKKRKNWEKYVSLKHESRTF